MDIRICKDNEIDSVRKIWDYCFDDGVDYSNFYFENKFRAKDAVVLEYNKELISAIHLNQHKIMLFDKIYEVSYVVGVSTLPQARGLGKMGQLMSYSLNEMYKRGQELSILMPIDFRLYSKFGYVNTYDMLNSKLDIFSLSKFKIKGEFYQADESKIEDLIDIYEESLKYRNAYAIRNKKYYKELIEEMKIEEGYIYINYIDSKPQAYIVYSISQGQFIVRESYYKNIDAYKSILKFIFNHNTQCKKLNMTSVIDDPLRHILDNPKDHEFEIKPFMMSRIINLEKLIKGININTDKNIVVKVIDPYILDNNGVFLIGKNKDDNKTIKRLVSDASYDIELGIDKFTTIIFSYYSPQEFALINSVEIEMVEKLYSILSIEKKVNHINEYI
ncbi:GNAT family N-acetyltransferase [Peptostreptococcus equinus]|uniref:GNAT family N-acetyltransferase n=1 Tax=Peptostreptococcus equinus TaxID=3003601 RepID=A0ABY7JLH3_9FIRM|nr:GNAT family N-acetyltransferase [Peptostreptococcus sp. CBA3647]WAW14203.1 GNAT family N-acetyltransferase [Peptostreptococcus sp. CBA3647]